MPDLTPLTDAELKTIGDLIDTVPGPGPALSWTSEARLLAEVDRLRAERHSNCNAEAWAAAARVARELRTERDALAEDVDHLTRQRDAAEQDLVAWSDRIDAVLALHGEGFCETCNAEGPCPTRRALAPRSLRERWESATTPPAPESPRPPAEVHAPGSTAETGSTGVPEPEDSAQASDGLEYECPRCCRWAKWTDGQSIEAGDESDEFWCQTCGAETPLGNCSSRPLPVPSTEEDTE